MVTEALIPDPTDAAVWLIGSAAEPILGVQQGPTALVNVHDPAACAGRACVIHGPSGHHMAGWPLNWRDDRGLMERICPHGIGHPDPDDVAYRERVNQRGFGVHGCDGCCVPPELSRGGSGS